MADIASAWIGLAGGVIGAAATQLAGWTQWRRQRRSDQDERLRMHAEALLQQARRVRAVPVGRPPADNDATIVTVTTALSDTVEALRLFAQPELYRRAQIIEQCSRDLLSAKIQQLTDDEISEDNEALKEATRRFVSMFESLSLGPGELIARTLPFGRRSHRHDEQLDP